MSDQQTADGGVSFRVEIEASLDDDAAGELVSPFFRFRAPNGETVETRPLDENTDAADASRTSEGDEADGANGAWSSSLSLAVIIPHVAEDDGVDGADVDDGANEDGAGGVGADVDADANDEAVENEAGVDGEASTSMMSDVINSALKRIMMSFHPGQTVEEVVALIAEHEECQFDAEEIELRLGAVDGGLMAPERTLAYYRLQAGAALGVVHRPVIDDDDEAAGADDADVDATSSRSATALPPPAAPLKPNFGVLRKWCSEYSPDSSYACEDLARMIAAQPFVTFALADKADDARATAATTEVETEDGAAAPPGRNFLKLFHLDMSSMLSSSSKPGLMSVEQLYALPDAGNSDGALPKPPLGLRRLRLRISVATPLLDRETERLLNPIRITLRGARDLPGVNITSSVQQRSLRPDPYRLLQQQCEPTYALLRLFDGDESTGRVVCTAPVSQASKVDFGGLSSVFLGGDQDQVALHEQLRTGSLLVELHDRDAPDGEWRDAAVQRWERAIAGGWHLTLDEQDRLRAERDAAAKIAAAEATERAEEEDAADENEDDQEEEQLEIAPEDMLTEPMDVWDVIDMARNESFERIASAGERYAHAVASFKLDGLLDVSKLRSHAFLRRTKLKAEEELEQGLDASWRAAKSHEYLARTGQHVTASDAGMDETTGDADGDGMVDLNVHVKLSSNLAQAKRRRVPKGFVVADLDLTSEQKLVRQPGDFAAANSSLSLSLSMAHPVAAPADLASTVDPEGFAAATAAAAADDASEPAFDDDLGAFTRMVLVFEYHNADMLRAVLESTESVNRNALPDPEISMKTYQLSDAEKASAAAGTLDIICGFTVIDDHYRMIVLEGLAGAGRGMARMASIVTKLREQNSCRTRMLWNPDARFKSRIYTCFSVDLKKIKLRDPLPIIAKSPSIYMRAIVTEACFEGLHRLIMLREANRMLELQHMELFPLPSMILQVESRYGESISVQDIDGSEPKPLRQMKSTKWEAGASLRDATNSMAGAADTLALDDTLETPTVGGLLKAKKTHGKAALDMDNSAYLEARANWRPKDYLTEQRQAAVDMRRAARRRMREAWSEREAAYKENGPTFVYSGQTLQFTEAQKRELASKLSMDTKATYTYSADFQSLAVMMVDEDKMRRDAQLASKAKWTTPGGFVYPPAKTRAELIRHPKQLSEARREDLRAEWVENEMHPKPVSRQSKLAPGQQEFDATPSKELDIFANNAELYGKNFFQSVFLGGDAATRAREAARLKAKEENEWKAKVVVDSIQFTAHGNTRGQTDQRNNAPSQLDKCNDFLAPIPGGERANAKSLRIVRNARLPSGKNVPLRALPPACINVDEYEDPPDFATSFRKDEPSKFTATDKRTGRPINFQTQIHRLAGVSPSKKSNCKYMRMTDEGLQTRAVKPMQPHEKVGLRWAASQRHNPSSSS